MSKTYLTRNTLLRRLKSLNDELAWDEFVFYYRDFIFSIINKLGVQQSDCDDLSQQVMLKIWNSIKSFTYTQKPGSFRNWIYTITKNAVMNYFKRNKLITKHHEQIVVTASSTVFKPEIDLLISEEWEAYVSGLAFENIRKKVSEQTMEAFLSSLRGESVEETAARLDLEENSVYIYKNRVKKRLVAEIKNLREMLE